MTSESICEKLLMVISQGGVPNMIITDLAPNLVGNLMAQIYWLLGIEKKQTLSYSSKCLGQHEQFDRKMAASIRCLLLDPKGVERRMGHCSTSRRICVSNKRQRRNTFVTHGYLAWTRRSYAD